MLAEFLTELTDSRGQALYHVAARDRQNNAAGTMWSCRSLTIPTSINCGCLASMLAAD